MEDKPTIKLLDYKIDLLCEQVKAGFAGVHERQDKTNGNVKDNTNWRLRNEKVPIIVYSLVGTILTAVVIATLSLILI